MIQDRSDPNELLGKLEVFNEHDGLEYPSTESWNSNLVGDCPKNEGSDLPCNLGNHVAENAIPNVSFYGRFLSNCSFMWVNFDNANVN